MFINLLMVYLGGVICYGLILIRQYIEVSRRTDFKQDLQQISTMTFWVLAIIGIICQSMAWVWFAPYDFFGIFNKEKTNNK